MKCRFSRILICAVMLLLALAAIGSVAEEDVVQLPKDLKVIKENAFRGATSITKVIVPEGTVEIGEGAFADSSIKEIVLPSTIERIAEDAFRGCEELDITAPEGSFAHSWGVDNGFIELEEDKFIFIYDVNEDGTLTISGFEGSMPSDLVIPSEINGKTVTIIWDSAFVECSTIKTLLIPSTIKQIGSSAFWGCDGIVSVEIPEGVQRIGLATFGDCKNLEKLVIPESVTRISSNYGTNVITSSPKAVLYVKPGSYAEEYAKMNSCAYDNGSGELMLTGITMDADTYYLGDECTWTVHTHGGTGTLQYKYVIMINWNETDIGSDGYVTENTFTYKLDQLGDIQLMVSAKDDTERYYQMTSSYFSVIGKENGYSFSKDPVLDGVYINGYEGDYSGEVTLPDMLGGLPVSGIGYRAFRNRQDITSIVIPDAVESISGGAFQGCKNLTSVQMPENLRNIYSDAFADCENLTSLALSWNIEWIIDDAFDGTSEDFKLYVYEGSFAHEWCEEKGVRYEFREDEADVEFLTTENEDGTLTITGIKGYAPKELVIPAKIGEKKVTRINGYSFQSMDTLESVIIEEGIETIGDYVLSECVNLLTVTIPQSVNYIDYGLAYLCPKAVLIVKDGSYAMEYALDNERAYDNGSGELQITGIIVDRREAIVGENCTWTVYTYGGVGEKQYKYELMKNASPTGIGSDGYVTDEFYTVTVNEGGYYELRVIVKDENGNEIQSIGGYMTVYAEENGFLYESWSETEALVTGYRNDIVGELTIPETIGGKNVVGIYMSAFYGFDKITSISMPNSVWQIGNQSFEECTSLESVVLPESITDIGYAAFRSCVSLKEVVIPESVTQLSGENFRSCSQLTKVVLPETLERIDYCTFAECPKLESLLIPKNVSYIATNAFESHSSTLKLSVYENSYAHEWCVKNNVPFEFVSDVEDTGEVIRLKWAMGTGGNAPIDNALVLEELNRMSRELINVECDIQYFTDDQLQNALNNGAEFDIMYTCGWYNNTAQLVREGKLLNLSISTIQKYAPDMYSTISKQAWDLARINGGLYAIPVQKDYASMYFITYPTQIAKNLGYTIPDKIESFDELTNFLVAWKKTLPAGEYPVMISKEFREVDSTFEYIDRNSMIGCANGTDKVISIFDDPKTLEHYVTLGKWYDLGLINPNANEVDDDNIGEGKMKISVVQAWPGYDFSISNGYDTSMTCISEPFLTKDSVQAAMNALSANLADQPERVAAALRYMNLCFNNQLFVDTLRFGVKGYHWNYVTEAQNPDCAGAVQRTQMGFDNYAPWGFAQPAYFETSFTVSDAQIAGTAKPPVFNQYEMYYDAIDKYGTVSKLNGFSMDLSNWIQTLADMAVIKEKYYADIATGAVSIEDCYDELMAELNAAGLQEMILDAQKQLDRWNGK